MTLKYRVLVKLVFDQGSDRIREYGILHPVHALDFEQLSMDETEELLVMQASETVEQIRFSYVFEPVDLQPLDPNFFQIGVYWIVNVGETPGILHTLTSAASNNLRKLCVRYSDREGYAPEDADTEPDTAVASEVRSLFLSIYPRLELTFDLPQPCAATFLGFLRTAMGI